MIHDIFISTPGHQCLHVTILPEDVPQTVRGESMQTVVVSEGSPASADFRSVTVCVEGVRCRCAKRLAFVLEEDIRILFSRVTGDRGGSPPLTDEAVRAMVRAELRWCR
ncbi:MAG: hypothetical protein WC353_00395 [Candidatus Peribacter sp.]|jgi:hypothetical protein